MSFWWRDPSECRGDSANVSQVRRKDQSEVCISLRLLISNLYLFLQHTLTPSHERAYYRFTISAYYRFTISAVLGQHHSPPEDFMSTTWRRNLVISFALLAIVAVPVTLLANHSWGAITGPAPATPSP